MYKLADYLIEWCEKQFKKELEQTTKINQEEYEVLKELDDKWKWITRDKGGLLCCYKSKPRKVGYLKNTMWGQNLPDFYCLNSSYKFSFIQWEDEEPHNIAELIDEYESSLIKSTPWTPNPLDFESEDTKVKTKEELIEKWESYKNGARTVANSKAIEYADRFINDLNQLDEPEVLSQEWIDENGRIGHFQHGGGIDFDYFVKARDLQNLLVPKQEEVDQAYKDGYEKGKEHASEKQTEETETVASVLVDYLLASAKLKLALRMEVEELEE